MGKHFFDTDKGRLPLDRVDGRLKVTGAATYAAEYDIPGLTYGVLIASSIAGGIIRNIETKSAERSPGVIAVISHLNRPPVPGYDAPSESQNPKMLSGHEFRLFYDNKVYHNGQSVALVIADTFERAQHAASLVKVQYEKEPFQTNPVANAGKAITPERTDPEYKRGIPDAYKTAPVKVEQEYMTPWQIHNAMEPHAAIAFWEDGNKVTLYNKTQCVKRSQQNIMKTFKLKKENIQVYSKFGGGAFGSASRYGRRIVAALWVLKKQSNR